MTEINNTNMKGLSVPAAIVIVGVIMVLGFGATVAYVGFSVGGGAGGIITAGNDGTPTITVQSGACVQEATPGVLLEVVNPLNTTATQYTAATVKIYKGDFSLANLPDSESYKIDVTSSATGSDAVSGVTFQCGETYTFVIVGASGRVSALSTVTLDEQQPSVRLESQDQAGLIARAKDNTADGFIYGDSEVSASTFIATGGSFYNTTANATYDGVQAGVGQVINTGGSIDYTFTFKTDTSSALDTRYTDQNLYLLINQDDNSDWEEPGVSGTYNKIGASFSKVDCGAINSKIANDGWDFCYTVTQGNNPVLLEKGRELVVDFNNVPKENVNPSDNVVFGLATSGIYKQTLGNGLASGTHKDDSSDTVVHTIQQYTAVVA